MSKQNEQRDILFSRKVKKLLSDAYASGWRKSKKHQKRTNFLGLNRKEINKIFEVWYYSKMWHRIHEPQADKEQKIINP